MAKYCELTDTVDPGLVMEERHLDKAAVYLDAELRKRGFDESALTLPIAVLTEIAALMAMRLACYEQPVNENEVFNKKIEGYTVLIDSLLGSLTLESLGLTIDDTVSSGVYVALI